MNLILLHHEFVFSKPTDDCKLLRNNNQIVETISKNINMDHGEGGSEGEEERRGEERRPIDLIRHIIETAMTPPESDDDGERQGNQGNRLVTLGRNPELSEDLDDLY